MSLTRWLMKMCTNSSSFHIGAHQFLSLPVVMTSFPVFTTRYTDDLERNDVISGVSL